VVFNIKNALTVANYKAKSTRILLGAMCRAH